LLFMGGDRRAVAARLTKLVGLPGVEVQAGNYWMPQGLPVLKVVGGWDMSPIEEAKLAESEGFLSDVQRREVTDWWLAVPDGPNTPNWDIASTCTIHGKRGLLLVEAKAHEAELKKDGKRLENGASPASVENHKRICRAIGSASAGLENVVPGWHLSCDSHYQLANRFAWAWKLASMGIPVALVYLGFLRATEVSDLGKPFVDCADWSRIVLEHSQNIVPAGAWNRSIRVGHSVINPLIRACEQGVPT
jgi:hypothetical protein